MAMVAALVAYGTTTKLPSRSAGPTQFSLLAAGGASPGKTMHFSGVLTDPATGNPISGNVHMRFALFDAETAGTQLWFEDQPGVNVKKGVFNVQIGSATAFPETLPSGDDFFNGDARYLEMTINPPATPLAPRVLISRVGNAFHADKSSDLKCNKVDGCIEKGELKNNTVDKEKLEDKAVAKGKIDDGAVESAQIENGTVTADDLAAGAITASTLAGDALAFLRSLAGSRPLFGVANLGETGGSSRSGADAAIGEDGLPIAVVLREVPGAAEVHAVHCEDPACASVTDTNLGAASGGGSVGVVVGRDGLPVVIFNPEFNQGLTSARCRNTACTAVDPSVALGIGFDPAGHSVFEAMLAADGRPLVLTSHGLFGCNDDVCSSWSRRVGGQRPRADMMMGADGVPVEVGTSGGEVVVSRCGDPMCGGPGSSASLLDNVDVRAVAVARGPDGLPVVAVLGTFPDPAVGQIDALQLIHCTSADCATSDAGARRPTGGLEVEGATGADGRPIFVVPAARGRFTDPVLEVFRCGSDDCSVTTSSNVLPLVGAPRGEQIPDVQAHPAVTIGADGYPLILHRVQWDRSFVAAIHCANPYCVPFFREN